MAKVTMLITNNGHQYLTLTDSMAREYGATKYYPNEVIENGTLGKLIKVTKNPYSGIVYTILQNNKHFVIGKDGAEIQEFIK